ncbi:MAG: hypothetical protein KDB04_08335 [Acidimicrobiales bacterium]|nr:hypothetical protein [Acidimicrobiales bacterium]HRW37670.1 hypothetical protein [Aquihabitans sp.]
MDAFARSGLWPLRATWLLLALTAVPLADDALAGRAPEVRATVAVLGYGGWAAVVVALLVPRTTSLTVVRTVVPAVAIGVLAAAAHGDVRPLGVIAGALGALATALALAPWVADSLVDGSSYGPERRLSLRVPSVVAVVAVATWTVLAAAVVGAPLLLATRHWALGAIVLAVAAALAVLGGRSIHQLSRRWVVLVPTGLVLHDPLTMPEPQLFLRQTVRHLGPATAGITDELVTEDLTGGASGLALELVLLEPVELLVHHGRGEAATRAVHRVLFTPARPATLLDAARAHRLPVG